MHGGVHNWQHQPVETALRLHEAYVDSLADRIARFGMHLDESGLPLSQLDWTTLDAFDDLWYWAQDHLSMFDDRNARLVAGEPIPWHPYMPDTEIPSGWPSWSGYPDLSLEAAEFSSGMAAMLARHAIDHWGARWIFGDSTCAEHERNQSLLEIPRPFEHRAAKFGPVRFSPERAVAGSVHNFYRHPLWHARPVWHTLHSRVRTVFSDWSGLNPAEAERFHDGYVGGHVRRLSDFREWLQRRGLDTRTMAFDRASDVDVIWQWAQTNVTFAEQVTIPRVEFRSWCPQLAQGAEPSPALPRWTELNLSAETLDFASGLAACVVEVALRSWGADWTIGGRRGDARAANRTHLQVNPVNGSDPTGPRARPTWLNVELEVATWLGQAIVSTKRRPPRQPMWRTILGESTLIGQFSALYEVPSPPWTAWRARFEPRLLPAHVATSTPTEHPTFTHAVPATPPAPTAASVPIAAVPPGPPVGIPVAPQPIVEEPVANAATNAVADHAHAHAHADDPFAGAPGSLDPSLEPTTISPAPEPFVDRVPPLSPDPYMTPPPAVPVPVASAPLPPEAFADGLDIRVEPDDVQGERFWIIEIDADTARAQPTVVDRFASRLNRSRGVASAARTSDEWVSLRMNRFGASDLEAVESLVFRVWDQTKVTHRAPAMS